MSPIFVPGSVDVAPSILAAQAKPMMPHRSQEFEALFHSAAGKARKLFNTEQDVMLLSTNGTGMQEAGIRNFVQDSVLCCANGVFADRWYEIAHANQKEAERVEIEWGKEVSADQLANALQKRHYEAVTIIHNETSTGVMSPIKELADTIRSVSPNTLILVDAVSSLGGVNIQMDEWGIDYLFTVSQMCLGLPPGLSLAAASERALQRARNIAGRGWYFDLIRIQKHLHLDSTPSTPVTPLIYALNVQLDRLQEEGLENRCTRHATMANYFLSWAVENDMQPLAAEPHHSHTVSVIQNSKSWDFEELNAFLKQRGMQIGNGLDILKSRTFRVAHMGELQMRDIEGLIAALSAFDEQHSE